MPASFPSTTNRAVFLSYAREDTAAAGRIAEALRSQGVEVWFDQNELRGGDAWDQKIRRQIDACTLFIPLISSNTEERGKGYFRLEWKLAVEQTHLLMEGAPFVVPVVVDDTPDSAAAVPAEFRRVQWTRLPGALPTPQFVEQVKRLLGGTNQPPAAAGRVEAAPAASPAPAPRAGPAATTWCLIGGLLATIAIVAWFVLRPAPPGAAAQERPVQQAAQAVNAKSIAVLPFDNMSEEKDSLFFTDGIHEDILTNLALIRELHVVSRTSVMQYRGTTKSIRQIGAELRVAYVLEGSVRRAGNKVRVTGQLIDARTDEHVWAKAYDRDATDIFGIQAELSQEIAGALAAAISPQEKTLIERRPTENLAAYDFFLKGRDSHNRSPTGSPIYLRQEESYLQQAVDADPNFAAAWGLLAEVDALFVFWDIDHTPERLAKADAAIGNAVRLAPDAPDVIRSLGTYAYYAYRDYPRAAEQYEKIARLQPNDATVFSSLGLILRRQGRWAESLAQLRRATELDPGNVGYVRNILQSFIYARRWDEAVATQKRLIEMMPDQIRERLALCYLHSTATGSFKEGDELLARMTPEQLNSPRVINWRRIRAVHKDDYAEFRKMDALQPFFGEDGGEPTNQALLAAEALAAHGDIQAARARLADYPAEVRARIGREPANSRLYSTLAEMEALLGNSEEALRLSHKSVELLPESRDTIDGPSLSYHAAQIYCWTGDKDRALAELARLLRVPSQADVWNIRQEPMFAPLRADPRFEAMLKDPKSTEPLF